MAVLLTCGATEPEAFKCTLVDLGNAGQKPGALTAVLSAQGKVAGHTLDADNKTSGFIWIDDQKEGLGEYRPAGINDSGMVVVNNAAGTSAFILQSQESRALPDLGGGITVAQALNSQGTVAGYSMNKEGQPQAFVYHGQQITGLGTLGGPWSRAYDVSDDGSVTGDSATEELATHAFLYDDGKMRDLGTLGAGKNSYGRGVCNRQVAGFADCEQPRSNKEGSDVLAFIYRNGKMQSLGTLGGKQSAANSINHLGMVVGTAQTEEGRYHGFLYYREKMMDLNDMLPKEAKDWELISATDINSAGEIIGIGNKNKEPHIFLLKILNMPAEISADIVTR